MHCDNVYRVPHLRTQGYLCITNIASNTAFRGYGGPQVGRGLPPAATAGLWGLRRSLAELCCRCSSHIPLGVLSLGFLGGQPPAPRLARLAALRAAAFPSPATHN